MRYSTYIYGRTLNIDFREICSPDKGLSPKSIRLVKELINTDVISNGDINRLRYLFVREREQILFGVGFSHRDILEKHLWTDLTRKRGLRSFVGIVIEAEEFNKLDAIPVDGDFFINLYLQYIYQVWDLEDRPKNRKAIISKISECSQAENWCNLDGNMTFNVDESICRFFHKEDENTILHSLKNCFSSIAIGLNVESHVFSAFRRFNVAIPNVICLDTQITHDDYLLVNNHRSEDISQRIRDGYKGQCKTKETRDNAMEGGSRSDNVGRRPAILSSLRKSESLDNNSIKKRAVQDNDLMNIEWGDDDTPNFSERSIDNSHEHQSSATLNKDNNSHGIPDDNFIDDKNDGVVPDDALKKVFRPRLVVLLIILLAIVMLLMFWMFE